CALLPRQADATGGTAYPQVLTLLRQPVGQDDLLILVLEEHATSRTLRQIARGEFQSSFPVRVSAAIGDVQVRPAQQFRGRSQQFIAGGPAQDFERQLVDSSHIESGVAELPCTRDVLVQGGDLRVELAGEIARECRQDNARRNAVRQYRSIR